MFGVVVPGAARFSVGFRIRVRARAWAKFSYVFSVEDATTPGARFRA